MTLEGAFAPGAHLRGKITTKGYDHLTMELWAEKLEPERLFSYRWHPFAIDPKVDYSKEPLTTVTFKLTETATGSHLNITETGFDAIPADRRAKAFAMNDAGWSTQAKQIADYLAKAS